MGARRHRPRKVLECSQALLSGNARATNRVYALAGSDARLILRRSCAHGAGRLRPDSHHPGSDRAGMDLKLTGSAR